MRDLADRVIVVTGGNRGLGFFTALRLAERGASIVLASRNAERAGAAVHAIQVAVPGAAATTLPLDLAEPRSVAAAGERLRDFERLDAVVENAGLVHFPRRRHETPDGLELIRATNFYGHFALTAAALPVLERTEGSRVVTLGSLSVLGARPRLDDLQLRRRFGAFHAYALSKLATSSFGFELDRRLRAARSGIRAIVAHPGYAISGRTRWVPGVNEPSRLTRLLDNLQAPVAQSKETGARPVVRAVTDPDAQGGDYYGPLLWLRGRAVKARPPGIVTDRALAAAIWADAEAATGVALLSR